MNWDQSSIPIGPDPEIPKSVLTQIWPLIGACEVRTHPAAPRARIHPTHSGEVDRQSVALACKLLVMDDLDARHLARQFDI